MLKHLDYCRAIKLVLKSNFKKNKTKTGEHNAVVLFKVQELYLKGDSCNASTIEYLLKIKVVIGKSR